MSDAEMHAELVSTLVEERNTLRGNLNLREADCLRLEAENRLLQVQVAGLERRKPQHDRATEALKRKVQENEHEMARLRESLMRAEGEGAAWERGYEARANYARILEGDLAGAREELREALQTVKALRARLAPIEKAERVEDTAKRNREIWSLRMKGVTYREIAEQMGLSIGRARQIAMKAERQIAHATEVYDGKVLNPIVYGVWHEFTHDGRVGLS